MHSVLNEGELSDLLAGVMDAAGKKVSKNNKTYMRGSLSKYTKNLIMSFPVLCDDTVSIETANLISKACERNVASMLEILLSVMSLSGNNGVEIIRKLHKNIDTDTSIDDIIDKINDFVDESADISEAEKREIIRDLREQFMNQKSFPVESLSERSLNDYSVRKGYYDAVLVSENSVIRELSALNEALEEIEEADDPYADNKEGRAQEEHEWKRGKEARDREKSARDAEKHEWEKEDRKHNYKGEKEREASRRKYEKERDAEKNAREDERDAKKAKERRSEDDRKMLLGMAGKRLVDSDVKKSNELQPTLMIVTFTEILDNGEKGDTKSFVCGIKSRLVIMEAEDIVERLGTLSKTAPSLKNFIRATTGEISFVKDFLLAVDKAKLDAKNAIKKGPRAQLWNLLEDRGRKNSGSRRVTRSNDSSAITTLVVNQETVNYMKNQYKFDLEVEKNAKEIIQHYNLLCLVIADESSEVAKFMYDANKVFDTYSYAVLEKESRNKDNEKKLVNLLNKSGR